MNPEAGNMANVVVDIKETTFDNNIGMEILSSTNVITGLVGHLQDTSGILEGYREGIHERDKSIKYRFIVWLDHGIDTLLRNGQYLTVTKKKHTFTKAWATTDHTEQYVIRNVTQINANDSFYACGLTRKDQGS